MADNGTRAVSTRQRRFVAALVAAPTVRDAAAAADIGETTAWRYLQDPGVRVARVADALQIDKSSAYRRVKVAERGGFLVNLESKRGRPARLVLGEALPEEEAVLPTPEELMRVCSVIPPETTATVQPYEKAECNPSATVQPRENGVLIGDGHDEVPF
jgi:hypothetical protein